MCDVLAPKCDVLTSKSQFLPKRNHVGEYKERTKGSTELLTTSIQVLRQSQEEREKENELIQSFFTTVFELGLTCSPNQTFKELEALTSEQRTLVEKLTTASEEYIWWLKLFVDTFDSYLSWGDLDSFAICKVRSGIQYFTELFSLDFTSDEGGTFSKEIANLDKQLKIWKNNWECDIFLSEIPDGLPKHHWWWY